jgi:hypothetical protein
MTNSNNKEEQVKADFTKINEDPILFSLLYDLDLLPEQLEEGTPNWGMMLCIIEHWKMKPVSSTADASEKGASK